MEVPNIPFNENERLAALQSMNVLDTPEEAHFDRLVTMAQRIFNVPIASISFVDRDRVWFKACRGLDVKEVDRDISFCGHTINTHDVLVVEDTLKDIRFFDNPLVVNEPHLRFYAGVPFGIDDKLHIGSLCILDDKPRHFSPSDIALLQDLGKVVVRELAASKIASTDELTQINNRRGFNAIAQLWLNQEHAANDSSTLLFIDLDKFKSINDKYGHTIGDTALQYFAAILQRHMRDADVLSRYGGDEFVILMPNTNNKEAQYSVERIKNDLHEKGLHLSWREKLAFSHGIIEFYPHENKDLYGLLEEADTLMYQRKNKVFKLNV